MRQLGDLLVWCVLVTVLAAAVYFTPKFAEYMSDERRAPQKASSSPTFVHSRPIAHHEHTVSHRSPGIVMDRQLRLQPVLMGQPRTCDE
jgi:hypothetical protein